MKWVTARLKEHTNPPTVNQDALIKMTPPEIVDFVGQPALDSARRSIVGECVPTYVKCPTIHHVFDETHKKSVPPNPVERAADIMVTLPGRFEVVYKDWKAVDRVDHGTEIWRPKWQRQS